MNPQISVGVFGQRDFRGVGAGPLDDCWVCSDQMCIHGCAPWKPIYDVRAYRQAAGVPDTDTGSEGGALESSLKAIHALHSDLAVELYRGSWLGFLAKAKNGRMVSASVWSRALGYVTDFAHRVAFYWNGASWRMLDPLKPSFSNVVDVSEAFVKTAFLQHPDAAEVNCLIFPTVDDAFKTHPLYTAQDASEQQLAAARSLGFNQGKTKAAAAAAAVQEA